MALLMTYSQELSFILTDFETGKVNIQLAVSVKKREYRCIQLRDIIKTHF